MGLTKFPWSIIILLAVSTLVFAIFEVRASRKLQQANALISVQRNELEQLQLTREQSSNLAQPEVERALSNPSIQPNPDFTPSPPASSPPQSPFSAETASRDQFPKSSWTFAGYSNVESTLQSIMWSRAGGDAQAASRALAPEMQARLLEMHKLETPNEISEGVSNEMLNVTGFQIVSRQTLSNGQVCTRVRSSLKDGRTEDAMVTFANIEGEWRISDYGPLTATSEANGESD